jgi:hypothetical protein
MRLIRALSASLLLSGVCCLGLSAQKWDPIVTVGPGYVDTAARQTVRTASGVVYLITNGSPTDNAGPGPSFVAIYRGSPSGNPTSFQEADAANRPTDSMRIGGVDCRLGSNGMIQCIYESNGDGNAWYVNFNTATNTWATTPSNTSATKEIIVGMNGQPPNRFRSRVALALDSNQIPHVIYPNAIDGGLTYANRIGSTWSAGQELTNSTHTEHPSLTFDKSGVLHLVYYDINSGNIFYQERSASGSWSSAETVATGMLITVDQAPSVAVDSQNNAWICFVTSTATGDTYQLRKRTGANSYVSMNPPNAAGHAPSVYIDAHDNVYAFEGHDINVIQPFVKVLISGTWGPYTQLSTGPPTRDGGSSPRFDPLWPASTVDIDNTALDETNGSFGLTYYIHGTPPGAAATPTADLSPATLTFASQGVGTASAVQIVTLKNNGGAGLILSSPPAVSGADAGDFVLDAATTTCSSGTTVAPSGGTCLIGLKFIPSASGLRGAVLTLTDNVGGVNGATQTVTLNGTGAGPTADLSTATLTFASQGVGTASAVQILTLKNNGGAALIIASAPVLSGVDASDFVLDAATTTCSSGTMVAPSGGTCAIGLKFIPSASGQRGAVLTLTDNAGGVNGATQTVTLNGTGIGPDFSLSSAPSAGVTVAAGQTATFTLTVTPLQNFPGSISFTASGLPQNASGSFNPVTVTPNGNTVSTMFQVATTSRTALLLAPRNLSNPPVVSFQAWFAGLALVLVLTNAFLLRRVKGRKNFLAKALVPLLLTFLCLFAGCGAMNQVPVGSGGTPAGLSRITITASSGSLSHTTVVNLTVN